MIVMFVRPRPTVFRGLRVSIGKKKIGVSGILVAHYGLGDVDEAFVWMDRAIDVRDDMIFPIAAYPFLDPLRSDPRYVALLKKLNYDPAGNGVRRPVAAAPPPGV
jgi:hypothetical protein